MINSFLQKDMIVLALYSIRIALGIIPFEKIHQLRKLNGLPGHPVSSMKGEQKHQYWLTWNGNIKS